MSREQKSIEKLQAANKEAERIRFEKVNGICKALSIEQLKDLLWFIEGGNKVQQLYDVANAHIKLRPSIK